jgi:hypothetical protein
MSKAGICDAKFIRVFFKNIPINYLIPKVWCDMMITKEKNARYMALQVAPVPAVYGVVLSGFEVSESSFLYNVILLRLSCAVPTAEA